MRACGNDVPRAFVVLFLFPVSEEGFAPDSLFLGGFHRSPLLEYPPHVFVPGKFRGRFCHVSARCFFQGGVFSGHDPSIGKRGHKNLPPPRWISVSRTRIARRPSSPRGTSARSSDRPRLSECPTDRPRRLGDVPSGPGAKRDLGRSGVRAFGGVAARDARASSAFS